MKEMYEVLNAILNGMKGEDEGYMDQNTREYNRATDILDDFIEQCK